MGLFNGKTLLELGTNNGSVDIVKYAAVEGAHVIVVDYLPPEKSEAKLFSHEHYLISTTDKASLESLANKKHIDGVFCGVSENNILSAFGLSKKIGKKWFFNKKQWDMFQKKDIFKKLCKKYGIPTPQQFVLSDKYEKDKLALIDYPVIVKPVDSSSSRGIHICGNEEELKIGYIDALRMSPSKKVIVEKYVVGDEISATYTIINGVCRLSMLSQMYYNREQSKMVPLPDAYIYPSKHLSKYISDMDSKVKKMITSSGLKNGSIFITGIANEDSFWFFEAGLRLAGTLPYIFVEHINGINIMKIMTEYVLNGEINDKNAIFLEDPFLKNKICCLYSLLNKGGRIAKVNGVDTVQNLKNVIKVIEQKKVGDIVIPDGTLNQIQIRFYIVADNITDIKQTIKAIKQNVSVLDDFGEDMLLKSSLPDNL